MVRLWILLLLFGLILTAPGAVSADPVKVLLLDYHAPTEHDVLMSHLCVEPCVRGRGCPAEYVDAGVRYWSQDFLVFRPDYLGSRAPFVIEGFESKGIDFISFSGHHASGFTGEMGRGRFDTEKLSLQLADAPPEVERFFTNPSLVMLQGCRTDVKSKFDGNPIEYVLHVIEETQVREEQFERLLAAVQQIGGVQQAYRALFPNACLLGYRGSQVPGGRFEIYGQVQKWLRALAGLPTGAANLRFDMSGVYRDRQRFDELNRRIEAECRTWPCNLCRTSEASYRPLAKGLARHLRQERERIHLQGKARPTTQATRLENRLESASFYSNTRWSCSSEAPGTAPVWPDPVDESPFGKLFLELLLLEIEGLEIPQRRQLRAELAHRLGRIELLEEDRLVLVDWMQGEPLEKLHRFLGRPIFDLSTFRQRDLFRFLAVAGCDRCLEPVFSPKTHSLLRENAATHLGPEVGSPIWMAALQDPDPRVRRAAAGRLLPDLAPEVLKLALAHPDDEVRGLADARLREVTEPPPSMEPALSAPLPAEPISSPASPRATETPGPAS